MKKKIILYMVLVLWTSSNIKGQCWRVQEEFDEEVRLSEIVFIDSLRGWIVGFENPDDNFSILLYRTGDGGNTWHKIYDKEGADCCQHLVALDENHLIMGISSQEIYKSNDGGYHWTPIPIPDELLGTDKYAYAIDFVTPDVGWVTIDRQSLFHTIDGGQTWERQYLTEDSLLVTLPATYFFDEQRGVISTLVGLYATEDGGEHWEMVVYTPPNAYVEKITFVNDSIGWAIGHNLEQSYKTVDGGQNWELMEIQPEGNGVLGSVAGVYFLNEDFGWISMRGLPQEDILGIITTKDGGLSWQFQSSDFITIPYGDLLSGDIFMLSQDKGFVTTLNNKLLRYRAGLPPCSAAVTNHPLFDWTSLYPYIEWEMPYELDGVCVDGYELRFNYKIAGEQVEALRVDVGDVNSYQVEEPFDPSSSIELRVIPYSNLYGNRVDLYPDECSATISYLYTRECPALPTPIDTFICQGEDFVWDGHVYSEPGSYEIAYLDSLGCDSTLTLNLQWFEPPVQTVIDTAIIPGTAIDGVVYEQDTIFSQLYSAATGCDSIVTYVINIITSTERPEYNPVWAIYPNPTREARVYLMGSKAWQEATLYDTQGHLIQQWKGKYVAGRNELKLEPLSSGVYYLVISNAEGVWTKRLVKI